MASLLSRAFPFRPSLHLRHLAQSAPTRRAHPAANPKNPQRYFVPRNSNGNLPVYSEIRNNGTQYFVHIRGVDGQAHLLAQQLRISLFKAPCAKLARAKVDVEHGKNVVISGNVEKNEIIEWLKARGF